MMPLAALAVAGCLAVNPASDRIALGDLAPALGEIAPERRDTVVAFAPAPGMERVFPLAELRRIAARLALPQPPVRELCFARPVAPLSPEMLMNAMRAGLPEAQIELLDYSRVPAPAGQVEFPPGGLRPAAGGCALWSGTVSYGGRHRFPVWAKVKVRVAVSRVVAATRLDPGRVVEASQLRVETREEAPGERRFAADVGEIAGRMPLRPIAAGSPLAALWFAAAPEVSRGDRVRVEVRSGGAVVTVEGQAETSGSAGQTITVRNLDSKRRFSARVEGKGRVSVGL